MTTDAPDTPTPPPPPQRMRITGLHHITIIVADLDRSAAFYRDVLGLALVRQGSNDDDPDARHFWFGDPHASPGTLVSLMEYPQLHEGRVGRGTAHHFALTVDSVEELEAWREYLRSRGIDTTELLDRGPFQSLYLRDPDGNILELASR
jgi:glyoxylase I family protein